MVKFAFKELWLNNRYISAPNRIEKNCTVKLGVEKFDFGFHGERGAWEVNQ